MVTVALQNSFAGEVHTHKWIDPTKNFLNLITYIACRAVGLVATCLQSVNLWKSTVEDFLEPFNETKKNKIRSDRIRLVRKFWISLIWEFKVILKILSNVELFIEL